MDDGSYNSDISFTAKRQAKMALDSAIGNLDVRDVVLYLNEAIINVLDVYKINNKMGYSETVSNICSRNIDKLESIFPKNYSSWLTTLNDYINLTSLNKMVGEVVVNYLYTLNSKSGYKKRDVHLIMDVQHINRIDSLKSNILFKNANRDIIITYLMSIDRFDDLDESFKFAITDLFKPFRLEIYKCIESIDHNFVKINKMLIGHVLDSGILNRDIPLFLRYVNETLNMYKYKIEKDVFFIEDDEFRDTLIYIRDIVDEQYIFLKKLDMKRKNRNVESGGLLDEYDLLGNYDILNSYEVIENYIRDIVKLLKEINNMISDHDSKNV